MVLRRCRKMLGDESEAVDAMQDVFVRLLKNRERLEDRGLSSLLFRIATNICLNRLRSMDRRPSEPDTELLMRIAHSSDDTGRVGARQLLRHIFALRKESTRTIAVLHLLDGMTLQETADEVGMSVSGVRKRLRKLRASLPELEETL